MKIAELASRTGATIPTIKYYLREGVLPAGTPSSPNQHRYAERHVTRVGLIQVLVHVAKIPVEAVKRLLGGKGSTEAMGDAIHDLLVTGAPNRVAQEEVDFIAGEMGWETDHSARWAAAAALTVLLDHGIPIQRYTIAKYAQAAKLVADQDFALYKADDDEERMEQVLIGTLVGNQLFAAFRILAQEAQR